MDYSLYICRTGELGFRAERDVAELKTDEGQDEESGEDMCRAYFQRLCSPTSCLEGMKWSDWPPAPGVTMARKIAVIATTEQGWTSRWRYLWKGTKSAKLSLARSGIPSKLFLEEKKHTPAVCQGNFYIQRTFQESAGSLQADEMQEEKNQIDVEIMKYGSSWERAERRVK